MAGRDEDDGGVVGEPEVGVRDGSACILFVAVNTS